MLVVLPLVLAAAIVLWLLPSYPGVVRTGDWALTELFTWHALHGTLLEGARSHYDFQHPGPLNFYLLAPLYGLGGCKIGGIVLGVVLLNLVTIAALLLVVRRMAGRSGFIALAVFLTYYQCFTGMETLKSPWCIAISHLPFLLTVVLFAAVAAGRLAYLPAALFGLSLVIQTHLAYTPSLAAVMGVSLTLSALPQRVRMNVGIPAPPSGRAARIVPPSLLLLALVWAPTVIREMTLPASNLARVVHHAAASGGDRSWRASLLLEVRVLAAFPRACLSGRAMPAERWQIDDPGAFAGDVALAVAQLAALAFAFHLARRRRRDFEVALSLLCAVLLVMMLISIRHIVGAFDPYMIYWMSAASLLILLAFASALGPVLYDRLRLETRWRWRGAVGAMILAALAAGCARNDRDITNVLMEDIAIEAREDVATRTLSTAAVAMLRSEGGPPYLVRITDEELWSSMAGLVTQLTKAGYPPGVEPQWLSMFGAPHAPAERPAGVLLLTDVRRGVWTRQHTTLRCVAESANAMLFWQPSPEMPRRGAKP